MRVIGVTGGIATGKSTFTAYLTAQGWPVVDADQIAKDVLQPGHPAYHAVLRRFASSASASASASASTVTATVTERPLVVAGVGSPIDRDALGKIIFSDEAARKDLNRITHPWIMYTMAKQILFAFLRGHAMVFLDVPLLYETGIHRWCQQSIVVTCDEETQLSRLLKRNPHLSLSAAQARITSQMPMAEKCRRATFVVPNNGTTSMLEERARVLLREITPARWRTVAMYFAFVGVLLGATAVCARFTVYGLSRLLLK